MKILVLGASGMLGSAVLRVLSEQRQLNVVGAVRNSDSTRLFPSALAERLVVGPDLAQADLLERFFGEIQPTVVVNCIGLRKEPATVPDPLKVLAMFAVLPHRLAQLCRRSNARLIHMSSDGVFSGSKGQYTEDDLPDAKDLYGIAKYLGEIRDPNTVTIRTSIIGHELRGSNGLLEWFLAQQVQCRCFARVIFSGLPTVVLATIIRDIILPRPNLAGIYHVAAKPISKFALLSLVAEIYGKKLTLIPDEELVIDRSLVADKFRRETAYEPPDWKQLIQIMYANK